MTTEDLESIKQTLLEINQMIKENKQIINYINSLNKEDYKKNKVFVVKFEEQTKLLEELEKDYNKFLEKIKIDAYINTLYLW